MKINKEENIIKDQYFDKFVKKAKQSKLYIDTNRAVLITESYKATEGEPSIIRRAKSFKFILDKMPINIEEGELILGAQSHKPLGVLLYPEYNSRLVEEGLDSLSTRPCEPIEAGKKTKKILRERVFPYWRGKSLHEVFWNRCSSFLKGVLFYDNQIYPPKDNELQGLGAIGTQGIGHIVFNPRLFTGLSNLKKEVEEKLNKSKDNSSELFYKATLISLEAIYNWIKRYSGLAYELGERNSDLDVKERFFKMSKICKHLLNDSPRTFHEALQYFWFLFVASYIAEGGIGYSTGPIDEYLYPYYKRDIEKGILKKEEAHNLIRHLFVKFGGWLTYSLKTDDAAKYHTGYQSFHFEIGRAPKKGRLTVNELSYIFIDTMIDLKLVNPSIRVHLSKNTPNDFLEKVVKLIRTGTGHPSIFNADLEVKYWLNNGISKEEATEGTTCGCVTPVLYGDSGYNYMGYLNVASLLSMSLNNGFWKYSNKQVGPFTGNPDDFNSFDDLINAFRKQTRHLAAANTLAFNLLMQCYAELCPAPFTSIFIDGCIENGLDKSWGGAKYNFPPHPSCVGVPDVINSFAAIKKFIYDEKKLSWKELLAAIDNNFKDNEYLRQMLLNRSPKWGNDNDYADEIAKKVINIIKEEYEKVTQVMYIGNGPQGSKDIAFASLGANIPFGKAVGALPWGKKEKEPVSDAISPNHDTDKNGPTAILKSVSKMNNAKNGFAILNIMLTHSAAKTESLMYFLKAFLELGVSHVQFNVFNKNILKEAQKNPEKYKGIIVRVSGYCAYFTELSKDLQDDIINRTVQEEII